MTNNQILKLLKAGVPFITVGSRLGSAPIGIIVRHFADDWNQAASSNFWLGADKTREKHWVYQEGTIATSRYMLSVYLQDLKLIGNFTICEETLTRIHLPNGLN